MELTPEERSAREGRLANKEHIGAIMRDFCRHAGFKILKDMIQAKIDDTRNEWLKAAGPAEAEAIRLAAKPWNDVMDMITKKILEGDAANLARRNESENLQ